MENNEQEVSLEDAFNLVLGHMQHGNFRVAEMILQDILSSQPDHYESYYILGLARYYLGNIDGSIEAFEKAIQDEEALAEWWCNYGIILNEKQRHEDAAAAFDKGIEIDPEYANSYWNKSHTLWLIGKYEDAEKAALDGIAKNDQIPEAWLNLGTAQVKLGKKEDAIKSWEKALELNPNLAFAWGNIGNVLREMGQLEECVEKCSKALELDPNFFQAMNNLGIAKLDLGDAQTAEEWLRKAIAVKLDYIEAHNNLAITLIRQNRYEEAITHARFAISFDETYSQAYINLSLAYRALGDIDKAQEAIQKAVYLQPDSTEVRIDLADVLFMQDKYGEAEIELERALKAEPDTPQLYLKLSNVLERGNKIQESMEAVEKAIAINSEMPEAHLRLGNICHVANRMEEAEAHFNKSLEMNPDLQISKLALAELYLSMGETERAKTYVEDAKKELSHLPSLYFTLGKIKKFTEEDPDFQQMVKMEENVESLGLDQASTLNFALFSAYEQIGDYEKAFAHLLKGNEYKRRLIPYDVEKQRNSFEQIKKNFSKENLKALENSGFKSDVPVFIVGMPRSGTTLTEQIISAHPDVYGAGELMDLSLADVEYGPLTAASSEKKGRWYVEKVQERDKSGKAKRITDKMPGNFSGLGKIVTILPDAKIIHCRRNPIDTCLSCFKQTFARGQYWSYNLEELGDYYNQYLDLMQHWREVIPDHFIESQYETVVGDFENQAHKLIDYVELPWHDACLEPHKNKRAVLTASKMQVIKPVYKTSVKAWQRYEKQLAPLIETLEKGMAKDLLNT